MSNPRNDPTRRGLILATATGLAVATAPALAAPRHLSFAEIGKEGDVACVYHCDFGDPARFSQMLNNISNHYSAYGSDPFALQIVVVAHGAGVKFFLGDLEDTPWREEVTVPRIFERVEDISKNGLKIYLCEITFSRLKVDKAKVRDVDFISFVPSGVAAVAALQSKGFAYVKVG